MFFFLLCLIMVALMGTGHTPDLYGWVMLVGLGWMAGYLDCRKFARSDQDRDRVLPPDAGEPSNDQATFES
jgi:hypothetical protein